MPGMDGLELLRAAARALRPTLPVILVTAHADVPSAVAAMREGAFDYVDQAVRQRRAARAGGARARARAARAREPLAAPGGRPRYAPETMVAESAAQPRAARAGAARGAEPRRRVLVQGESGTGKELVARLLHYWSERVGTPFVAVNCKAFAEGVLESELFGHERGAFTGAVAGPRRLLRARRTAARSSSTRSARSAPTSRRSCCACCRTARCSASAATKPRRVDVRVVAATNRDLRDEVAAGRFREDLYFRLNVIPIQLAPLRERREDVLPLARSLPRRATRRRRAGARAVAPRPRRALRAHAWPGNVRELENAIERAASWRAARRIEPEDLLLEPAVAQGSDPAGGSERAAQRDRRRPDASPIAKVAGAGRHAAGRRRSRHRGAGARRAARDLGPPRRSRAPPRRRAHDALPADEAVRHRGLSF